MSFPEHIATERLLLHRWRSEDHLDALAAVNAESGAVAYLNEGMPYTREESSRQSDRFANQWAEHGFGLCAAELRATGDLIGFVGVTHPMWFAACATEVEAGWRLHPAHWGHGYATEAARACVSAAWAHLDLDRIISIIDPHNAASIAVAQRLGMTPDVTVPHPQRPGDVMIWHIRRP
jgi:RimJ/RimL family protein N-acetyltransferase